MKDSTTAVLSVKLVVSRAQGRVERLCKYSIDAAWSDGPRYRRRGAATIDDVVGSSKHLSLRHDWLNTKYISASPNYRAYTSR